MLAHAVVVAQGVVFQPVVAIFRAHGEAMCMKAGVKSCTNCAPTIMLRLLQRTVSLWQVKFHTLLGRTVARATVVALGDAHLPKE